MAVDPLTVAAFAFEAAALLQQGWNALMKKRPEYEIFWKDLDRSTLQAESNVDAEAFERRARTDPDFVGIAIGLMRGAPDARKKLKEYFNQCIELTEDAYEERETVVERLVWKAEFVAGRATRDERDVAVAQRRLVEETVRATSDEQAEDLKAHIDARIAVSEQQVERAQSEEPEAEAIEEGTERLRLLATAREAEIERILERANAAFTKTVRDELDERIDQLQAPLVEPTEVTPAPEPSPAIVPVVRQDAAKAHVDELRAEDEEAATRIDALLSAGGPEAVVATLRPGGEMRETVGELVAAARIASDMGHFREAETAYLAARERETAPRNQARQLVRAYGMARVQGDEDRAERHLRAAEALDTTHPSVVMQRARRERNAMRALEMLEAVEPETDRDRTQLHLIRSEANLRIGNFDQARVDIEAAANSDPDDLGVRELRAVIPLFEAQDALAHKREPNPEELHDAAAELARVAVEIEQQQRYDESAQILARAIQSFALSGDLEGAEKHLESVQFVDRLSEAAREHLADAAITAQRPDLAAQFTGPDAPAEEVRLKWAEAQMFGDGRADERERAGSILAPALRSQDQDIKRTAAFSLLVGASNHLDVQWDEDAAQVVEAERPDVVANLRAERLGMEGKTDEAERVLLPHADDINALRQLRDLAARADNHEVARDRAREVVRRSRDDRDRLAYGRALYRAGDSLAATLEFLTVARSEEAERKYRRAAYGAVVEMAGEERDLAAVLETAAEWHAAFPEDSDALWNRLFALARLARHGAAYELYKDEGPEADSRQRALLLAEILHRGAPRLEALETLAELSDRYGRNEEGLEAIFIATAFASEPEGVELANELQERVREAVRTFPERFPESDFIRVMEVPTTPEGVRQFLEDMSGDSIRLQREAMERITAGHLPVNGWAASGPTKSVLQTWGRLRFLPLGFATDEGDHADREGAEAAIGGAAVWDPSSIFVAGGLGDPLDGVIRGALPGSMIANEVLDDISLAEAMAPEAGTGETVHDPKTGELLGIRDREEAETDREKRIATGSLKFAQQLEPRPSGLGQADERLKEFSEKAGEGPWEPLWASIALAQASGRPLYSDDRWIRALARFFAVPAFGTIALLDVLADRDAIAAEQRQAARQRLMQSRSWGLRPTGGELVAAGEEWGWRLHPVLAGALHDRAAWRAGPALYWLSVLEFLDAVYKQALDEFRSWVLRAVDCAQSSLPELPGSMAPDQALTMGFAIDENAYQMSKEGFQRLLADLRSLPSWLDAPGHDPLFHAIDRTLSAFAEQSEEFRHGVLLLLLQRLSAVDAALAYSTFVRVVPSTNPPRELGDA